MVEKSIVEKKDEVPRIVFRNYVPFDTVFFGERKTVGNYFTKPASLKAGFRGEGNGSRQVKRGTLKRILANKVEPLERQTKIAIYKLLKAEMQNKS